MEVRLCQFCRTPLGRGIYCPSCGLRQEFAAPPTAAFSSPGGSPAFAPAARPVPERWEGGYPHPIPPSRPGSLSRYWWLAALLVAAGVAIAGIIFSVVTYRSGHRWEQRANQTADRLEASQADATQVQYGLNLTRLEVAGVRGQLNSAQATVSAQQARIEQLSGEKEQAQDQQRQAEAGRQQAESDRDYYARLASIAGTAANDAASCIVAIDNAVTAINDYMDGLVSYAWVDALVNKVGPICSAADASYGTFRSAVGG